MNLVFFVLVHVHTWTHMFWHVYEYMCRVCIQMCVHDLWDETLSSCLLQSPSALFTEEALWTLSLSIWLGYLAGLHRSSPLFALWVLRTQKGETMSVQLFCVFRSELWYSLWLSKCFVHWVILLVHEHNFKSLSADYRFIMYSLYCVEMDFFCFSSIQEF